MFDASIHRHVHRGEIPFEGEAFFRAAIGRDAEEEEIFEEAQRLMNHPKFAEIRQAHEEGVEFTNTIKGRETKYVPDFPDPGFTNHEQRGFLISGIAFDHAPDLWKLTVLHEMHRLHLGLPKSGVSQEFISAASRAASDFATRFVGRIQ